MCGSRVDRVHAAQYFSARGEERMPHRRRSPGATPRGSAGARDAGVRDRASPQLRFARPARPVGTPFRCAGRCPRRYLRSRRPVRTLPVTVLSARRGSAEPASPAGPGSAMRARGPLRKPCHVTGVRPAWQGTRIQIEGLRGRWLTKQTSSLLRGRVLRFPQWRKRIPDCGPVSAAPGAASSHLPPSERVSP